MRKQFVDGRLAGFTHPTVFTIRKYHLNIIKTDDHYNPSTDELTLKALVTMTE